MLSWRWHGGKYSVRVVQTATTRILRHRFPGTCETVGQVFKFVWRLCWKINVVCMSLSPIISFQSQFVTYLLTFPRIIWWWVSISAGTSVVLSLLQDEPGCEHLVIHRVRKRLYPFFIFFSRCQVCGEWCKLHWLLLDTPNFDWNTRHSRGHKMFKMAPTKQQEAFCAVEYAKTTSGAFAFA